MNTKVKQRVRNGKRRMQRRLRVRQWHEQFRPMFKARNIHYDLADKTQGLGCGGIGALHLLAQRLGLPEAINGERHLRVRRIERVRHRLGVRGAGGEQRNGKHQCPHG